MLDGLGFECGWGRDFSFLHYGSGAHPDFYSVGAGVPCGSKRAGLSS